MNMAIRGIKADLGGEPADAFRRDLHKNLKYDFVLAVVAADSELLAFLQRITDDVAAATNIGDPTHLKNSIRQSILFARRSATIGRNFSRPDC